MGRNRIILSGGGTGGHIYPAISIANELKSRDNNSEILFVGARDKMEMKIVPRYGFEILGLWISGFNRGKIFNNLLFPVKLLVSVFQSIILIKKFKPDVVVGTGGYASGPTLYIANLFNIPTLIQEQNSYPGITNKILSKRVNTVCVAYRNLDKFFPKDKLVLTGNPVRSSISSNADYIDYLKYLNLQVIWQCGKLYYDQYKSMVDSENIKLVDFLDEINLAFSVSDFIISRAGASSVSELSIIGKPVIFIPSPNVAEDHQLKNAQAIVENDAAILVEEKNLEKDLKKKINMLNSSSELRNKLSKNIKKLAFVNATNDIVNEIKKIMN